MSLVARLLIGCTGSGLALYMAFAMPLPERWADYLDRHRKVDDLVLLALLLLSVSGWIVAVVV